MQILQVKWMTKSLNERNEWRYQMDEPTRRIPVELENGVIAHVEGTDLGGRHDVDEGVIPRFEGALDIVRAMSSQIYDTMAALKPQRFEVELGFELGVESG